MDFQTFVILWFGISLRYYLVGKCDQTKLHFPLENDLSVGKRYQQAILDGIIITKMQSVVEDLSYRILNSGIQQLY